MCSGVEGSSGPRSVAFDRFCTGYALVAVDVQLCPLAFGQKLTVSNAKTKRIPRHRIVVLISLLLSNTLQVATKYLLIAYLIYWCTESSSNCFSMESGKCCRED
jgi:hypothetical protein